MNYKFNLLLAGVILTFVFFTSCKSKKGLINTYKIEITSCDTTKLELAFDLNTDETNWLNVNQDKCNRINEFFKMFGYTKESIEYMKSFVQLKVTDDEYKLERYIELYCLLERNPNALIDGNLEIKSKN